MDINTINGVIRALFPAIVAYLVGAGYIPAADYGPLLAGLIAVLSAVWSIWSKKPPVAPSP